MRRDIYSFLEFETQLMLPKATTVAGISKVWDVCKLCLRLDCKNSTLTYLMATTSSTATAAAAALKSPTYFWKIINSHSVDNLTENDGADKNHLVR